MKKIIVLILFTSLVFAQCQDYIRLAEERLAPPYPNYFGAANEYIHAAECYEESGDIHMANIYYEKAATHYVQAADLLVEGGDYYQKAKSYEFAGNSFFKIGDTESALKYYNKAKEIYERYGYSTEAGTLTAMIADKFGKTENKVDISTIMGVILVVIGIGIFALIRGRRETFPEESPSQKPKVKEFEKEFVKRSREEFTFPEREKPEEEETRPLTPKEKLAKKLREKYTPK